MIVAGEEKRVGAEELLRQEARPEKQPRGAKASRGKRILSLLNMPFALWFLSSVVVAGLGTLYTWYQSYNSERVRKAEIERRLNIEISSRISEALVALRLDESRIEAGQRYFGSSFYKEALLYLENRVTDEQGNWMDWGVYPEYQRRSFRSLIFELSAVVEPSMLPSLREARVGYEGLIALDDQAALVEDYTKPPPQDKSLSLAATRKAIEILGGLQANPFWKAELEFQRPARKSLFARPGKPR